MGVVQLPDELKRVIERQIAEGRATSEAEFVAAAVQRYAEALDADDDEILVAAAEGIADMAAGRFELIAGPADLQRLRTDLGNTLDELARQRGAAER